MSRQEIREIVARCSGLLEGVQIREEVDEFGNSEYEGGYKNTDEIIGACNDVLKLNDRRRK
ncbi:MAG: hypothetical protein Q8N88_04035 [Nanoarchaeota archaeon]|nr:hypothetical protein [Nanoarchaeota archaeon]